jgi:hypothetical protein
MRLQWMCCVLTILVPSSGLVQDQYINPVPSAPANYFDDDIITLVYDPVGEFWLAHPVDDGGRESTTPELTVLQIQSSEDFFGDIPWCLIGLFCSNRPRELFMLEPGGFTAFPTMADVVPGLSFEKLSNDLSVAGSFAGGEKLTSADLHVVPEAYSSVLTGMSLFIVIQAYRRRCFLRGLSLAKWQADAIKMIR